MAYQTVFDPENERHLLQTHLYYVEFTELSLKSMKYYNKALSISYASLGSYINKFAIVSPGNWQAQFYTRKAVYATCGYKANKEQTSFSDPRQSVVPMLGPLHVALNGKEDLMQNYHNFFKYVYGTISRKTNSQRNQDRGAQLSCWK